MSEVIRGYEIIGEWHQANEGVWAECQKGGKSYFIKKYDKIATEPDASKIGTMFSERAYNDHLERFNTFRNRRGRINTQLKTTSGAGGSIYTTTTANGGSCACGSVASVSTASASTCSHCGTTCLSGTGSLCPRCGCTMTSIS